MEVRMAITELNQIDAIGKTGKDLTLVIVDPLDWKYEDMHLELLQDKVNNYVSYIVEKKYAEKYGNSFENFVIDIHFQHGVTQTCIDLLSAFSRALESEKVSFKVNLPS